jgi:2-oxoglutarate ferredoxin oxidoreductase subunit gamma
VKNREREASMNEKIIIAGSGGQGVLTIGVFLARIAALEKKNVTWLPSYGAEKRGGFSFCDLCISDEQIFSPVVEKPTTFIVFDQRAYERYKSKIGAGTLIIENSSLVKGGKDAGRKFSVPASEIAKNMSFIKATNIVLAGAYMEATQFFKRESAYTVIETLLKGKPAEFVEKNIMAFNQGVKFVKDRSLFDGINEGIKSVKGKFF